MNRTLTRLKQQAAKASYDLGHRMFWTVHKDGPRQFLAGVCRRCGLTVKCDSGASSGATVEGDAVMIACSDPSETASSG